MSEDIDYKAEYDKIKAERDAFEKSLNEYIDKTNKLEADLKVQQTINRKTVGSSSEAPKEETTKVSIRDAFNSYKAKIKE